MRFHDYFHGCSAPTRNRTWNLLIKRQLPSVLACSAIRSNPHLQTPEKRPQLPRFLPRVDGADVDWLLPLAQRALSPAWLRFMETGEPTEEMIEADQEFMRDIIRYVRAYPDLDESLLADDVKGQFDYLFGAMAQRAALRARGKGK